MRGIIAFISLTPTLSRGEREKSPYSALTQTERLLGACRTWD